MSKIIVTDNPDRVKKVDGQLVIERDKENKKAKLYADVEVGEISDLVRTEFNTVKWITFKYKISTTEYWIFTVPSAIDVSSFSEWLSYAWSANGPIGELDQKYVPIIGSYYKSGGSPSYIAVNTSSLEFNSTVKSLRIAGSSSSKTAYLNDTTTGITILSSFNL